MRRIITLLAGALLALGLTAGPALAFEPPGNQDPYLFGCTDDLVSHPVLGHPGAAGLVGARATVEDNTDNPRGTAWKAVDNTADHLIVDGACPNSE